MYSKYVIVYLNLTICCKSYGYQSMYYHLMIGESPIVVMNARAHLCHNISSSLKITHNKKYPNDMYMHVLDLES